MNGDTARPGARFAFESDPDAAQYVESYDPQAEEEAVSRYLSRLVGDHEAPPPPTQSSGNASRATISGQVADNGSWSSFMSSLKGIDTAPVVNSNTNTSTSAGVSTTFTSNSGANFSNGSASGARRPQARNPFASDEIPVATVKNPFEPVPAPPAPPVPEPLPAPTALRAETTPPAPSVDRIVVPAAEPVVIEKSPAEPQVESPLPDWFQSEGMRMLRSRDYAAAITYYSALCDDDPRHAEGWLGLGAAFLGVENSVEASRMLVKGREMQPDFPVGALVRAVKPHDPVYWYNFTASLIDMRRAVAYQCADEVLNEILASDATSHSLYARALDVRQSVREALRTRADRQRRKATTGSARNQGPTARTMVLWVVSVLAVAAVLVGAARAMVGSSKPLTAERVDAVTPPPAAPAAAVEPASTAPATAPAAPAAASKTATFIIDTNQGQGFSVKVDGQPVGSTPTGVEVAADRPHTIVVMGGEHYRTFQTVVQPTGGEERTIVADLKPSGH
jgi:hypothetical protein